MPFEGRPRFDDDDVRNLFLGHEAFLPEFVESRVGGFDLVGTLRTSDGLLRVRVAARASDDPGTRVRTPRIGLSMTPYLDRERLPSGRDAGQDPIREVLGAISERDREIERFCGLYAEPAPTVRRHVIPPDRMDQPFPRELLAERGARAGDRIEVSVYLRNACVQRCLFCSATRQSRSGMHAEEDVERVRELVAEVIRPARRRGAMPVVTLEADDLAGHPRLAEIAAMIHGASPFPLHVMTPPNRLADPRRAAVVAALPSVASVMTTLFGASSGTHDAIAGREGAFAETVRALRFLDKVRRVRVEVKVLVSRQSVQELPVILDIVEHFSAALSLVFPYDDIQDDGADDGKSWSQGVVPRLDVVREALERVAGRLHARRVSLTDFPDCAVPPVLRDRVVCEHPDVVARYPLRPPCTGCSRKGSCARVSWAYFTAHGVAGFAPE